MAVKIVIASGGTAGHIVPSLALADALRAKGAEVVFVGTEDRLEAELVPKASYEINFLSVSGLSRSNPLKAAKSVGQSLLAVGKARKILKATDAQGVVGGGGYVSGPVGLAAASMKIPLVVTEADSHLGITNRILARFARKVCLSFPIDGLEGGKYLLTGRPIPKSSLVADGEQARSRYGIGSDQTVLFIFGGSQGARSINFAAVDAFSESVQIGEHAIAVIHICGKRDYPELSKLIGERPHYRLIDYAYDDFAPLLATADLVVSRAGGSIFEVAAAGKPSILVPYPHATQDHQTGNARWLVERGAAVTIPDRELSGERLFSSVSELLGDPLRLSHMGEAARAAARPDAADRIADLVLAEVKS